MSTTITSLRPNVTREEALRMLRPGLLGRISAGPLRSVADVYIPFRLFRVEVTSAGRTRTRHFVFDSAFGVLDPYELEQPPTPEEVATIQTRNAPAASLDDESLRSALVDAVRRQIYQEGFFRLRDLEIRAQATEVTLHVPYWVGFYGRGDQAELRVLDAVRRRAEGKKMRDVLTQWLMTAGPSAGRPRSG